MLNAGTDSGASPRAASTACRYGRRVDRPWSSSVPPRTTQPWRSCTGCRPRSGRLDSARSSAFVFPRHCDHLQVAGMSSTRSVSINRLMTNALPVSPLADSGRGCSNSARGVGSDLQRVATSPAAQPPSRGPLRLGAFREAGLSSAARVFQIASVTARLRPGSRRQTSRKSPSSEIRPGAPLGRSVIV